MKNTKKIVLTIISAFVLMGSFNQAFAQAEFDSTRAENLDLHAVAELFRDSEDLEKFEQALNNPVNAINNLDLNNDNEIDFIRVTEQTKDDTRLIVLQSVLGENEFQDVATIAVEKESGGKYNLQIQGDTVIYGANYYVIPANNNFSAWNVVRWLFRPNYRAYVSPYSYRIYPTWWSVRRPVAINVYRARTGAFAGRRDFVTTKTVTVRTVNKINYRPRASTSVIRTNVIRTSPRPAVQTRTVITTKQTAPAKTNTRNGGQRRGKN